MSEDEKQVDILARNAMKEWTELDVKLRQIASLGRIVSVPPRALTAHVLQALPRLLHPFVPDKSRRHLCPEIGPDAKTVRSAHA
jgi:hypothetical protein